MSTARRLVTLAGCGIAVAGTVAGQEVLRPSVALSIAQEVRAVFDKCRGAVVKIEATDELGELSGTGFFIDPNGTLYTSYTIGGASRHITVHFGGRRYVARRLIAEPRCGIALLKVETDGPCPFLSIGQSRALNVGDPLIAVGYSMDLPVSPTWGTLAGVDIKYLGRYFATRHLRANIPVQRGQGGAPLLDMTGQTVGVLISSLDGGSACYGLPIEAAERVRKDFMHHGEVRPGWLGVACSEAPEPVAGSTAQVDAVAEKSPGAKAGLLAGDILLRVGERQIVSPEDVLDAAFFIGAEDELTLEVVRRGETVTLVATASEPPTGPRTAGDVPVFAPNFGGSDLRGWPMKLDSDQDR